MKQEKPAKKIKFAEAAIRSGLISERRYRRAVELASTEDETVISKTLVNSGVITQYQAQQLLNGRTRLSLGPYLITDFIGQGGMGQVFKAVHRVMGRQCAVKVLPIEKSTKESRASFMREIQLQAELDNPYVVRAFDAGQDGNVHYLVTEYVPGTDLRNLIRTRIRDELGPLSMEDAAVVISQVAKGLQYAHDVGLVHRDIKPGNILVTPEGHAKLADIGLASWSMGLQDDPRAGKIVGTADYLSPEQVRNPLSVGPASDIYSLGCTLYYTVTGKVPFPGGDSKSKCRRHCEETPWHPRNLAPELSEDFVDTIADMMEKDPSRRIASAKEVAERLEVWAEASVGGASVGQMPTMTSPEEPIQSWTPPPPPMEPAQLRESKDQGDVSGSEFLGRSGSASNFSAGPPSEAGNGNESLGILTASSSPRRGQGLTIAMTLAIAVPISLFVGAIIGFVVRGNLLP